MDQKTLETTVKQLEDRIAALEAEDPRKSTRYPYTYACDHIRDKFGVESRADASALMRTMAEKLGHDEHRRIAIVFAEEYLAKHKC